MSKAPYELSPDEVERWLIKARRSLAGYAAELRLSRDTESRAMIEKHFFLLREVAEHHPGRREEIEALIELYQPQAKQ